MPFLDIVLVLLLVASFFTGLVRGLGREVLAWLGLALAVWLAGQWYLGLAQALLGLAGPQSARLVAWLLIALVVLGAVWFAVSFIYVGLRLYTVSWLSHLLGGISGLAKGAVVGALLLLVGASLLPDSRYLHNTRLAHHYAPLRERLAPWVLPTLAKPRTSLQSTS